LPVLIAVLGHVFVLGALLLLRLQRHGDPLGWVLTAILLLGSVRTISFEVTHARRPGALTVVVLTCWLASAVLAWLGAWSGAF